MEWMKKLIQAQLYLSSIIEFYNKENNIELQKRDTLTIKFLKKYIHYAKHRIQPDLTDEVP